MHIISPWIEDRERIERERRANRRRAAVPLVVIAFGAGLIAGVMVCCFAQ